MKASSTTEAPDTSRAIVTIPNLISAARLATVPFFLWLWFAGSTEVAVVVYAIGASTDFVDGFVARRTGAISELGKLLDPLADRIFILALAIALVGDGTLPWPLALAVIARDIAILSLYPLVQKRGVPKIAVNFVGKSATAALFFGLTWLALSQTDFGVAEIGDEVGIGFVILGAVLYWVAGVMYARLALTGLATGRERIT
ncbi:MAG: CDP-alcohol phosphatidyltransferase family protein [Actinobacteria bacterium]|nr:CDP-alcohol phosphatidyltransferase family protein [Actinomycetota bacterium]